MENLCIILPASNFIGFFLSTIKGYILTQGRTEINNQIQKNQIYM
nr:hypothetical protein [Mucilaginibacter sp. SP1R1]